MTHSEGTFVKEGIVLSAPKDSTSTVVKEDVFINFVAWNVSRKGSTGDKLEEVSITEQVNT